ncbi:MAG TPA: hypothetical protein DCQ37_06090, partial [Desulfobacteraceae bacterium]|nr:hypothetical protein [Desulfobacteraceae bacterium]
MSFLKKIFGFGKKSEKKTASFHSNKSRKAGSLMLALEERYLYDAAGIAAAFLPLAAKQHADTTDAHRSDNARQADNAQHTEITAEKSLPDLLAKAVPPAADRHSTEIVFVDSTVKDYQKIVESLPANTQIIVLDPNRDGVKQISEVLSQQTDVKAIHIVSHGSDG